MIIKKLLYLSLMFSFILCKQTIAQQSGVFLGANCGIQYTRILNSLDADAGNLAKPKLTFKPAIGVNIGWQFASHWTAQTGAIVSQQGQKYKASASKDSVFETNLSYVKFPLVLKYNTNSAKKYSFVILAGAQINSVYRVETSRKDFFGYFSKTLISAKAVYEKLPIELVIGMGTQYNVSEKINISFLLLGDYSLTDIEVTDKKPANRPKSQNFTLLVPQFGINIYL